MRRGITYQDVSDFEKMYNMSFKNTCYVTNLKNGITQQFNTHDILDQLMDGENIQYKTNFNIKRKYAAIDIYILINGDQVYWARIKSVREW